MKRREVLMRAAREQAEGLGHKVGRFRKHVGAWRARCRGCGRTVSVRVKGSRTSLLLTVFGSAVDVKCTAPGKVRRFFRSMRKALL